MTATPEADRPTSGVAVWFVSGHLVALFLTLAVPLYAGGESILSRNGDEAGPFLAVAAVIFGLALAGRRRPFAAGIASGMVALYSVAFFLVTVVAVLFDSLLDESAGTDFGGGMVAVVAVVVIGFAAVLASAAQWRASSPSPLTPVAFFGSIACVAMVVGFAVPVEGSTWSQSLGFESHAVLGIGAVVALTLFALIGVAGFVRGRWGVGLLAGFLGMIAIGWLTSRTNDQQRVFRWTGIDGGSGFHPASVIGFWSAAGLFVIHAIRQFATSPSGSPRASAPRTPPQWAPDPFGRASMRYYDGSTWTEHVADAHSNTFTAPATPLPAPPQSESPRPPAPSQPLTPPQPTSPQPAPSPSPPPTGSPVVIPPQPSPQPPKALPPTEAVVHFTDGRVVPLGRAIVIGRAPTTPDGYEHAELVAVSDTTVSKTHAIVELVGGTTHLRDFGSSNGVEVQRGGDLYRVVSEEQLRAGDLVVLGDTTSFRIEWRSPDEPIPRLQTSPSVENGT